MPTPIVTPPSSAPQPERLSVLMEITNVWTRKPSTWETKNKVWAALQTWLKTDGNVELDDQGKPIPGFKLDGNGEPLIDTDGNLVLDPKNPVRARFDKGDVLVIDGKDEYTVEKQVKNVTRVRLEDGSKMPKTYWIFRSALANPEGGGPPFIGAFNGVDPTPATPAEIAASAINVAHYLQLPPGLPLAMAHIASGLKVSRSGEGADRRYGPFNFTEGEWLDLIARFPDLGLTLADIGRASAQITLATTRLKNLVDALGGPDGLNTTPTFAEAYVASVVGDAGLATKLFKDRKGGLDGVLSAVFSGADGAARIKALREAPGSIFAGAQSMQDVVAASGKLLGSVADVVNGLMGAYYDANPSQDPYDPHNGQRPWLDYCMARLTDDAGKPALAPHVAEYAAAVGVTDEAKIDADVTATGFVAWCLTKVDKRPANAPANAPTKIALPANPQSPASWQTWGIDATDLIPGTIVLYRTDPAGPPTLGIVRQLSSRNPKPEIVALVGAADKLWTLQAIPADTKVTVISRRWPSQWPLDDAPEGAYKTYSDSKCTKEAAIPAITADNYKILADASNRRYIKPEDYIKRTYALVQKSKLVNVKPADGAEFGITTSSAREWTILLTANTWQECGWKPTEWSDRGLFNGGGSFGLGQMSIGDGASNWGKGLTRTHAEIVDPNKNTIAIVKAHEYLICRDNRIAGKVNGKWQGIALLNGSYRRPAETTNKLSKAREMVDKALPNAK